VFRAVVRITGAGRLADFRERLRRLMIEDIDAEDYTEHHGEGVLEYRFQPARGIPFPAFTSASSEYPELRVEAEWEHDGVRGRAVIENGRLSEQAPDLDAQALVDVDVAPDGRLVLAMVCRNDRNALLGYAASADRHTYFRFVDGRLELIDPLIDPDGPDEALEEVAFAFVEDWIWYDEEEAPLERARYASYGYPVRGANLRSDKLALLRSRDGRFSSLDARTQAARAALVEQWLKSPQ
jgi:hypothetical protein